MEQNKKEENLKPKMDWTFENLTKNQRAFLLFQMKKKQEKEMEKNMKAVPSLKWWENEQEAKKSIEQQKPVTPEEAQAQFSRLRNEKTWNQEG